MPLHSIQPLPGGAALGRWHLTEAAAGLWPLLRDAPTYAPLLPARAQGLRQAQWLAGRVLVQQLLAAAGHGGAWPPLCNDPHGRPYLAGPGLQPAVSLSHAGEWVLALLAPPGRPVGIDVEAVRAKAQRIQTKFLSGAELAAAHRLAGGAEEAAPLLYSLLWSAKETLFKLSGQPGILFRENLLLDLPPALPWPTGQLPGRLRLGKVETRHQICTSQPAPDYVLTYCVG